MRLILIAVVALWMTGCATQKAPPTELSFPPIKYSEP